MSAECFRRERLFRTAAMDGGLKGAENALGGFMKISNERLEGLLPQEFGPKAVPGSGRDFENVLALQLEQGTDGISPPNPPLAGPGGFAPLRLAEVETENDDAALISGLVSEADDLLGVWEQYVATLGSGEVSAKFAWGMLAGMDARVQSLRAEMDKLGGQGQGLGAVINELEVLAATEKFKFNRGDYQ